jgi:chromosome partitioning protein
MVNSMAAKRSSQQRCKVLVLGGSKGGCGRSTLSRNLTVAARQSGLKVIGIDQDAQRTFKKWAGRREAAREKFPQLIDVEVVASSVSDWSSISNSLAGYDLAVVDTAPGVEHGLADMIAMCRQADYVLLPTSASTDDLESVVPYWLTLAENGAKGEFVLNKANRRTRSFAAARSALNRHGRVAPVEVPLLEDIASPFASGLAVVDYDRSKGGEVMQDVWLHVRRELGL